MTSSPAPVTLGTDQARTRLHELQYAATRLREKPLVWSIFLIVSANVVVFWSLANAVSNTLVGFTLALDTHAAMQLALGPWASNIAAKWQAGICGSYSRSAVRRRTGSREIRNTCSRSART